MKRLRKELLIGLLLFGILVSTLGTWITILSVREWYMQSGKIDNFDSMDYSTLSNGKYVQGKVNNSSGYFYEFEQDHYRKSRIYLMLVGDKKDKILGILVPWNKFKKYEELTKNTKEHLTINSFSTGDFYGKVKKYDDEMMEEVTKYIKYLGDDKERGCTLLPYYIYEYKSSYRLSDVFEGIISVIIGLIMIYLYFRPVFARIRTTKMKDSYDEEKLYVAPKEDKISVFADENWDDVMKEGAKKDE